MMQLGQQGDHGITLHLPPKTGKLRVRWNAMHTEQLLLSGQMYRADGPGIPRQMPIKPIPPEVDPDLDRKRLLLSTVFRYWGYTVVTDPLAYARAVKEAANFYGVASPTVRAWLEAHLFYGEHANATMSQTWRKGDRMETHVYGNG